MNRTKQIVIALGLLTTASATFAQTSATGGLLGQRYVDVGFGTQDIKGVNRNAHDASFSVNLPVTSGFDLELGYDYGWFRGSGVRASQHTIGTVGKAYAPMGAAKPFAGAALGYQWQRARAFGFRERDRGGVWALGLGAEVPVATDLVFTTSVSYADDFQGGSPGQFSYGVEANYWVTTTTAVYGSVGRTESRRDIPRSWNYEVGLRFRF
jgi:hypothetical protein